MSSLSDSATPAFEFRPSSIGVIDTNRSIHRTVSTALTQSTHGRSPNSTRLFVYLFTGELRMRASPHQSTSNEIIPRSWFRSAGMGIRVSNSSCTRRLRLASVNLVLASPCESKAQRTKFATSAPVPVPSAVVRIRRQSHCDDKEQLLRPSMTRPIGSGQ
jgi:hypothetical protein